MSVSYAELMRALEVDGYQQLENQFILMKLPEMVESGLLVGSFRLRELGYRIDRRYSDRAKFSSPGVYAIKSMIRTLSTSKDYTVDAIAATLEVAYAELLAGRKPNDTTVAMRAEIVHAVHAAAIDFSARQTIRITRDVSGTLPAAGTSVTKLIEADYAAVAASHNVETAAVKAIAKVESGGRSGFDDQNRPKILFEGHLFRKFTQRRFDKTHPHLSKAYPASREFYKWDQYARLYEALLLDPQAAVSAASWGMFQVMGFNHNGWPDPISFAAAMFVGESNHLKSFEAFCTANGVWKPLADKDWAAVAKAYNGKDYATNAYDTKMKAAFDALQPAKPK
ncbi:MAG: DUF3380 domain-containing protein [Sandarakinorhabdus sp.]|nr:DUF3380 domain-containing protein [Sandarakinorhabdus sp.]